MLGFFAVERTAHLAMGEKMHSGILFLKALVLFLLYSDYEKDSE